MAGGLGEDDMVLEAEMILEECLCVIEIYRGNTQWEHEKMNYKKAKGKRNRDGSVGMKYEVNVYTGRK